MAKAPTPPLTIWAVSDGRAGIEAQALGLAEAVARLRPAEIVVKHVRWKAGLGRLPWRLNLLPRLALSQPLGPPWPDIWIAAGRATLPLSTRLRRWSAGRTFVAQLQDPRTSPAAFDLVVPPQHDQLTGPNVFPIVGAPNRLTPERLAADRERFRARIDPLPAPRIALIVGGRSKAHRLPAARAAEIGREVASMVRESGGSLLASFTRRTPPAARTALTEALADVPGWLWDNQGENPYFAFLASADVILVTEDSVNLATDAAATGKPVMVLPLPGGSGKFRRFHNALRERGVTRAFIPRLTNWTYAPLHETQRAAVELLRRYDETISR